MLLGELQDAHKLEEQGGVSTLQAWVGLLQVARGKLLARGATRLKDVLSSDSCQPVPEFVL